MNEGEVLQTVCTSSGLLVADRIAMPKKKKAAPAKDELPGLLMRCSRADLEALVRASVEHAQPCTLESVRAVAAEKFVAGAAAQAVQGLDLRSAGTGQFERLSSFTHQQIFTQLPLKDRLTVCIAVCKAWRSMKEWPAMWKTLDGFDTRPTWINGKGLARLFSYLPANCAKNLAVVSTMEMEAKHLVNALKAHRRWEGGLTKKQTGVGAPQVTSLTLHGKRVSSTVLKAAAVLIAPSLTALDLGDNQTKFDTPELMAIVKAAPKLERLTLPTVKAGTLDRLHDVMKQMREGGDPILTHLQHGVRWGRDYTCDITPLSFTKLGARFPELTTLKLGGLQLPRRHLYIATGTTASWPSWLPPASAWECLPRLEQLEITGIEYNPNAQYSSGQPYTMEDERHNAAEFAGFVNTVLACAPRLEILKLGAEADAQRPLVHFSRGNCLIAKVISQSQTASRETDDFGLLLVISLL